MGRFVDVDSEEWGDLINRTLHLKRALESIMEQAQDTFVLEEMSFSSIKQAIWKISKTADEAVEKLETMPTPFAKQENK